MALLLCNSAPWSILNNQHLLLTPANMADQSQDRSLDGTYERARRLTIAMAAARMRSICARMALHSARLCAVPPHYYSLTLQERAALVSAPSVNHMCKTVVFENTKATVADCDDAFHSRFYAVIVQYTSEVSTSKFENFAFNLAQENGRAVSKRRFHWRLASPDDSLRLTGYVNNAGHVARHWHTSHSFARIPLKLFREVLCSRSHRVPGRFAQGHRVRRNSATCSRLHLDGGRLHTTTALPLHRRTSSHPSIFRRY